MPQISNPQNPAPLKIIIIGAGIAGLSTALALSHKSQEEKKYDITILEAASSLQEIGAGIQIPPNSSRYLIEWGLEEEFREKVCYPDALVVRKWDDGMEMGRLGLRDGEEKYGAPYWYIHRADYQKILHSAAIKAGIPILLNQHIRHITTSTGKPTIHLRDGKPIETDLLVGADGIHSQIRNCILSKPIEPIESPSCAHRLTIPASKMLTNPLTANLLSTPAATVWIQEEGNVIGYPIRSGTVYNLVLIRPGNASLGHWNEPGDMSELRSYYASWDPVVGVLLSLVEGCLKWKLGYLPPLKRWVGEGGDVVIVGDAAHAMLPNLAQGAATSLEDGVALAECLERDRELGLGGALRAFEGVRKGRCERISRASTAVGERGKGLNMRENVEAKRSDASFREWLYGYDTVKETNKFLDGLLAVNEKE